MGANDDGVEMHDGAKQKSNYFPTNELKIEWRKVRMIVSPLIAEP